MYTFLAFSKKRNGFAMNFKRAVAVCVYVRSLHRSKHAMGFFSSLPKHRHLRRLVFVASFSYLSFWPCSAAFCCSSTLRSAFCTFYYEKRERLISVPTRCFAPIKSLYFLARMQSTVLNSANVSTFLAGLCSSILVVRISS